VALLYITAFHLSQEFHQPVKKSLQGVKKAASNLSICISGQFLHIFSQLSVTNEK